MMHTTWRLQYLLYIYIYIYIYNITTAHTEARINVIHYSYRHCVSHK